MKTVRGTFKFLEKQDVKYLDFTSFNEEEFNMNFQEQYKLFTTRLLYIRFLSTLVFCLITMIWFLTFLVMKMVIGMEASMSQMALRLMLKRFYIMIFQSWIFWMNIRLQNILCINLINKVKKGKGIRWTKWFKLMKKS